MAYKLAFAIPPLDDHGGVNRVLIDLREGLCNMGHDVHFFTFGSSEVESDEKTHVINSEDSNEQKKQFENEYQKISKEKKFDVFFATNIRTHKICVEIKIENLFLVFHQGAFLKTKTFFHFLYRILYCRKIYNDQKLIGVSKGLIENIVHKYRINPKSINFIYNPFDRDRIFSLADKSVNDIPCGDFILHAGRFHQIKRHDRLIRAFSKMDTHLNLLLVGDGEEEDNIRDLVSEYRLSERVYFLGWKDNPYPYIQRSKLVVLTSDHEGLPTILIEALLLGKPVVSTNCLCGPSEIMTGELSAFLVPPDNENLLAENMLKALKEYPEIHQESLRKFTLNAICEKYIEIVETYQKN